MSSFNYTSSLTPLPIFVTKKKTSLIHNFKPFFWEVLLLGGGHVIKLNKKNSKLRGSSRVTKSIHSFARDVSFLNPPRKGGERGHCRIWRLQLPQRININ
jgi:hypothetical protein